MQTAQGNPGTLLSNLNNTAVGQGADLYRGEGALATAGEYHNGDIATCTPFELQRGVCVSTRAILGTTHEGH